MRVGILITSVGDFGKSGFYNSQEIGLAKALDRFCEEVLVYKAVNEFEKWTEFKIEGCKHTMLCQIPVRSYGVNGVWDCKVMDNTIDALIYFSDTQISVPKVYKWCNQNNIKMYPYIGIMKSHSTSKIKGTLVNLLFFRNICVYRKCTCLVKTPVVKKKLMDLRVKKCILAPVGLDLTLLNQNFREISVNKLKKKYNLDENNKILLFVGRMIPEKQPIRMIEIFKKLYAEDQRFHLIMIGKGELLDNVKKSAAEVIEAVTFIEQIPNKDIWEFYCMADAFVNLNQREIFGMAILEAMYYGCKVVAWRAPGPEYIIENGQTGFLANNDEEILKYIRKGNVDRNLVRKRVLNSFTWKHIAEKIYLLLQEQMKNEN